MQENTHAPKVGSGSPWGAVRSRRHIGRGCYVVETASHGGVWVPQDQLEDIPDAWRHFGERWAHGWGEQWYEEDCAALGPFHYLKLCHGSKQEDLVAELVALQETRWSKEDQQ